MGVHITMRDHHLTNADAIRVTNRSEIKRSPKVTSYPNPLEVLGTIEPKADVSTLEVIWVVLKNLLEHTEQRLLQHTRSGREVEFTLANSQVELVHEIYSDWLANLNSEVVKYKKDILPKPPYSETSPKEYRSYPIFTERSNEQ